MNKIVSIIIPHHNEVELLNRLLSSIPLRNDLEVLVVDDCSTESQIKSLKTLQRNYFKFQFYFLPLNKGGGGARNFGLSQATGDYVMFADSDDFFLPSISDILNLIDYNFDIYYFNAISLDTNDYSFRNRSARLNYWIKKYIQNGDEKNLRFLFGEPWCKIIKRSLINNNNIGFEESTIHNDTLFSYLIGYYAKNINVSNVCAYVITERPNSVSKGVSDEKLYTRARIFLDKNRFLQRQNINIVDRLFLSSYWEYLKHLDIRNFIQLNSKLGISMRYFLSIVVRILLQEIRFRISN